MGNYGLSSETKKKVKSTVLALRALLEGEFHPDTGEPIPPGGDVARQIARYGILVNKPESFKSENAPEYLTDEEKKKRERVCAAIKREVTIFGELSDKTALRRGMRAFIRQTSYTWVNRLLGLRCMEARGLLKDDRGELDFVVTPSDDYGGLPRRAWRIKGADPAKWQSAKVYDLQSVAIADACHQLTQEIRVLFDPEHDYGLIWPSPPTLNTLLQKIQELDGIARPSPFTAPDFLGWVYQYFQTIEKDLVFEAASKKKRKIEKDDIIPATQIFTEHYMVEYLVQNSLGRFWMEIHPDSNLSAKWAYYVKPPEENPPVERELKKAIEIKMIDPALGSGHFHLVSFDLLLDMYEEEIQNAGQPGWPETPSIKDKKDIPKAILEHNFFGIDIDARAVQIASLVLVMKARESGYEGPIDHLNLVVANSAPFESEAWHLFIQNLKKDGKHSVARVLAALGIQLKNLDEFGSLLRIEDEMKKIIQEEKKQWISQAERAPEQDYLFFEMSTPRQERLPFEKAITDEAFFDKLGAVIQNELDRFYQKARDEGLAEEAIMVADAERGFDFVRLSMQRYDVVYTNPPYMGNKNMGKRLKDFVKDKYTGGNRDLYAAFTLRCFEFLRETGILGMVSQQGWISLRTFTNFRAVPNKLLKGKKVAFKGILREARMNTLAHLGEHAFDDPSAAGAFVVIFTLQKLLPIDEHQITAFRLIGPKTPYEKMRLLRRAIKSGGKILNTVSQKIILELPDATLAYWLPKKLLSYLSGDEGHRFSDEAFVAHGLGTRCDYIVVRFHWEIDPKSEGWYPYSKGGGYGKWLGRDYFVVNYGNNGTFIRNYLNDRYPYLKGNLSRLVADTEYYFEAGLCYSEVGRGALGVRYLLQNSIPGHRGPGIYSLGRSIDEIAGYLNTRINSYLYRALNPSSLLLDYSYFGDLPVERQAFLGPEFAALVRAAVTLKSELVRCDPIESTFRNIRLASDETQTTERISCVLHTIEGTIEKHVFDSFDLERDDALSIIEETGKPAGWFPLIKGYDELPKISDFLPTIPREIENIPLDNGHLNFSNADLREIKSKLRTLYKSGGGSIGNEETQEEQGENFKDKDQIGAYIPIPAETFIEVLSQKLEIHPISIYLLLKEMREKEGLVCPSEQKRHAEDYATVMILRMLGYQWPKQVEAGEPLPVWADGDGIIPLTEGLGETTLLARIRERFGVEFGEEKEAAIEAQFGNIVGKPLERWLEEDFFARHVKQFKKRPIAWHIVSDPSAVNHEAGQSGKGKKKGARKKQKPAFSVMIHYHRFVDGDKGYRKLLLLKNKYLEKLMSQTRSELESLRGKGDDPTTFDRIAELDRKLVELEDFRDRLELVQEGKDPESSIFVRWKGPDEQPRGWRPDINDGVKINIAPWERLGMFPVKKIVGKVEMAPE